MRQVQEQMRAMQEQMQRPEVQEQMQEVQALMQDKSFASKVEKLRVSLLNIPVSSPMWALMCYACACSLCRVRMLHC